MGDDIHISVPGEEQIQEPETYEQAGEELVALMGTFMTRLDNQMAQNAELIARITILEETVAELRNRTYAEPEHRHDGLATAGHTHEEYATTEHSHETTNRQPDRRPESQHPYFRKIGR